MSRGTKKRSAFGILLISDGERCHQKEERKKEQGSGKLI